jgi:hypothetical protein
MNCPPISDRFIIADDAKLAAQLSCVLSQPGVYLSECRRQQLEAWRAEQARQLALFELKEDARRRGAPPPDATVSPRFSVRSRSQ